MHGIDPTSAIAPSQPRQLPFGKLPRRGNRVISRILQGAIPCHMSPQLSISDSTHRWMFRVEVASGDKPADLLDETGLEHAVESHFDSGVQMDSFKGRNYKFCDLHVGQDRTPPVLQRGDGLAGQSVHLESALDALRIVPVDACGRGRIHRFEFPMQGRPPGGRRLALDGGAYVEIRRRQRCQTVA
jgi:hypothetical protein